jgi:Zn-dependent peptidase ImmA (M78 family)
MRTHQSIERLVDKLLAEIAPDLAQPPVPVRDLAVRLGVDVRSQDADDNISGALLRSGDKRIIAVNAAHSGTRQRFTIAHEIGHLRLHKAEIFMDHDLRVDNPAAAGTPKIKIEALRASRAGEANTEEETEANRFAASLLMPVKLLVQTLEGRKFPMQGDDVSELAGLYQVSVQAMTYRLFNLGIPLSV